MSTFLVAKKNVPAGLQCARDHWLPCPGCDRCEVGACMAQQAGIMVPILPPNAGNSTSYVWAPPGPGTRCGHPTKGWTRETQRG